jgi:hypothetical protein
MGNGLTVRYLQAHAGWRCGGLRDFWDIAAPVG